MTTRRIKDEKIEQYIARYLQEVDENSKASLLHVVMVKLIKYMYAFIHVKHKKIEIKKITNLLNEIENVDLRILTALEISYFIATNYDESYMEELMSGLSRKVNHIKDTIVLIKTLILLYLLNEYKGNVEKSEIYLDKLFSIYEKADEPTRFYILNELIILGSNLPQGLGELVGAIGEEIDTIETELDKFYASNNLVNFIIKLGMKISSREYFEFASDLSRNFNDFLKTRLMIKLQDTVLNKYDRKDPEIISKVINYFINLILNSRIREQAFKFAIYYLVYLALIYEYDELILVAYRLLRNVDDDLVKNNLSYEICDIVMKEGVKQYDSKRIDIILEIIEKTEFTEWKLKEFKLLIDFIYRIPEKNRALVVAERLINYVKTGHTQDFKIESTLMISKALIDRRSRNRAKRLLEALETYLEKLKRKPYKYAYYMLKIKSLKQMARPSMMNIREVLDFKTNFSEEIAKIKNGIKIINYEMVKQLCWIARDQSSVEFLNDVINLIEETDDDDLKKRMMIELITTYHYLRK